MIGVRTQRRFGALRLFFIWRNYSAFISTSSPGDGVHDESSDRDVVRNERVMLHDGYAFLYGFFRVGESAEPLAEIHVAVFHHVDVVLRNPSFAHVFQHYFAVHVLHSAVRMPDNHHLLHSQFIDGHHQASHGTSERVVDGSSCVLYHLHVAVLDSQCGGEQFGQTCVHAGHNGNFLVGILVCDVFFISLALHERAVEFKQFVYHDSLYLGFFFRQKYIIFRLALIRDAGFFVFL